MGWTSYLEDILESIGAKVNRVVRPKPKHDALLKWDGGLTSRSNRDTSKAVGNQSVPCPKCKVSVKANRLNRHIKRVHKRKSSPAKSVNLKRRNVQIIDAEWVKCSCGISVKSYKSKCPFCYRSLKRSRRR
jgi:hypothetical protein